VNVWRGSLNVTGKFPGRKLYFVYEGRFSFSCFHDLLRYVLGGISRTVCLKVATVR
jgi:hypothetical protein